jgi:hypothetical protein
VCTLGLNAEKADPSVGAGAGDSTPETGTLTVTDPVFRTVLSDTSGVPSSDVPAHAGLEHGHALSQPWVSHHEGSETSGVTVGRPITGTHLRAAFTDTAPAAPPLACGITVGRSLTDTGATCRLPMPAVWAPSFVSQRVEDRVEIGVAENVSTLELTSVGVGDRSKQVLGVRSGG